MVFYLYHTPVDLQIKMMGPLAVLADMPNAVMYSISPSIGVSRFDIDKPGKN